MIKIALKHYIYEKCISILFNAINRNFRKPVKKSHFTFEVGEHYSFITIVEKTRILELTDVNIKNVIGSTLDATVGSYKAFDINYNLQESNMPSSGPPWAIWAASIDDITFVIR